MRRDSRYLAALIVGLAAAAPVAAQNPYYYYQQPMQQYPPGWNMQRYPQLQPQPQYYQQPQPQYYYQQQQPTVAYPQSQQTPVYGNQPSYQAPPTTTPHIPASQPTITQQEPPTQPFPIQRDPVFSAPQPGTVLPSMDMPAVVDDSGVVSLFSGSAPGGPKIWARSDYMMMWMKKGPNPVPLLTTGDPTVDANPGALGQSTTRVLFGGNSLDFGMTQGLRFTTGAWLNNDRTIGLEGAGSLFQRRSVSFSANSDANGNPGIYVPAFRLETNSEGAFTLADSVTAFSGGATITAQTRLWGAEANGLFNFYRRPKLEINGLVGFRYADLTESLNMRYNSTDLISGGTLNAFDSFGTRNQFYGGQLGARASYTGCRWSADLSGKIAMGVTHQTVDINGAASVAGGYNGLADATVPGGIFSQTSNIGRTTSNRFSVIPETELRVGYNLTSWLKLSAGYSAMYWSSVVRPGDQIDRNINLSTHPLFSNSGGVLIGNPGPNPLFNRTDFWTQGVNFGCELRF